MVFFRSEERVREWCEGRGAAMNPRARIEQLWTLATRWYGNRLDPNSRRPAAGEIPGIFADAGFTDDFWNPKSERYAK